MFWCFDAISYAFFENIFIVSVLSLLVAISIYSLALSSSLSFCDNALDGANAINDSNKTDIT